MGLPVQISLFYLLLNVRVNSVLGQISPTVRLPNGGVLHGTQLTSVNGRTIDTFLGIPYAEAPIGNLRFADPVAKKWTGDRNANIKSEPCPQINAFGTSPDPFGNEDCLYLNVYTPRDRRKNSLLPVMLYIHGGAYHMESADPAVYGPERLLDHKIVLVTIEYRLGPLGFLSTGTVNTPGNYGLKDQLLAMHWVKNNIRAFGGDPKQITLFGQSAGAASVSLHMVSPQSKGLFHKAILHSGSYFDPWAMVSKEKMVKRTEELAFLLGCWPNIPNNYNAMINCLRNIPADKIIAAHQRLFIYRKEPVTIFTPVIEPRTKRAFLTEDPRKLNAIHGNDMPIIIGATSEEGAIRTSEIVNVYSDEFKLVFDAVLPTAMLYDEKPKNVQERITANVKNYYFRNGLDWSLDNHQNLTQMISDRFFFIGMNQFIRQRFKARKIGDTYIYIFNHNGPVSATEVAAGGGRFYGVAHFDDLPFIFPFGQLGIPATQRDQQMYKAMPEMWTDFAKTGDPTPSKSKVKDHWKNAKGYPLKYAQIGSTYIAIPRSLTGNEILNQAVPSNNSQWISNYDEFNKEFKGENGEHRSAAESNSDFGNEEFFINGFQNATSRGNTHRKNDGRKTNKIHKKRRGRAKHCHSHHNQIYCKIIRNRQGNFFEPQTEYLYT